MLHFLDWTVLAAYVGVVVSLGLIAERRQARADDFFLGARQLPWALVGVSILATAFSATSLLGGPGEAFEHGLLWMQLQLGDLLAITIVILVFVPALRGPSFTTAYQFLETRFDRRVRRLASGLFQLQVLLRAGVLVYGPALALSTLMGWPLVWTIPSIGLLATMYTSLGGITAVIWTDALQLAVVLAGLGACIAQVAVDLPGGLGEAWGHAAAAGRLEWVDLETSWRSVRSLPGAILGYGLLSLSVAGTNQQTVQRFLSCRSVADAQRAAWTGWSVGAGVTALTLFVGVLLFGYYQSPSFDLESMPADQVFPHFVATRLAPGVAGLLVAAILAAAMSSLDSALNSLATAWTVDIREAGRTVDPSDPRRVRSARIATMVFGAGATAAALWLAGTGSLLELAVRVVGWFAGPILGIFVLALLARRPRPAAVLVGGMTGFLAVLAASFEGPWWPWPALGIWATGFGLLVTLTLSWVTERVWRDLGVPRPLD